MPSSLQPVFPVLYNFIMWQLLKLSGSHRLNTVVLDLTLLKNTVLKDQWWMLKMNHVAVSI